MPANATATLTLRLRDLASAGFRNVAKSATSSMNSVKRAAEQTRKAVDFSGQLSLVAGAMNQLKGSVDSFTDSTIGDFKDFEFQMERVRQLSGNLASGEFDALNKAAIELGESTFFTGMEAAQGLEQLAVAGFNAKQQLAAIQPVLRLTQASGGELGRTADIASDLLGSFGLKASDTARLTDILTATFTSSTTTLEDLFETYKLAGPIAKQAGISIEKLSVLTGVLGNAGLKGSVAGTALRGALIAMVDPSKKAGKALKSLWLGSGFIKDNLDDPLVILEGLRDAMSHMAGPERLEKLAQIFGKLRAGPMAVLVEALGNGAEGLDKLQTAVANSEGRTEAFGRAMEQTAKGKAKILESQIAKLRLEIGERLLPTQNKLMESFKGLVTWVSEFTKENPILTTAIGKTVVGFGALLAVAVPITYAVSALTPALALLGAGMNLLAVGPVMRLVGAVEGLQSGLLALGTTAGRVGAGMLTAGAVVAAAYAGYKIGEFLDEWIAGFLDLEQASLSAWLAVNSGMDDDVNKAVLALGEFFNSDTLKDAALGNMARNQADRDIAYNSPQSLDQNPTSLGLGGGGGGGRSQVDVNVKVDAEGRVKGTEVRTQDSKNTALAVGNVAAG